MSKKHLYIDIHTLQTVPPSCINRDDTGSPKTARFGDAKRARVSSQAWKKAMRDEFSHMLDINELGIRTKRAVELVAAEIQMIDKGMEEENAYEMAKSVIDAALKTKKNGGEPLKYEADGLTQKSLLFISRNEIRALADIALDSSFDKKVKERKAKAIMKSAITEVPKAIDISLFGRMVATDPELNVDAAVQVAHAISVSVSEQEFDYFTALDDCGNNDSAAMISTTEFLSATLYRYATVDVYHLCENLGSQNAAKKAVEVFLEAFVKSMPTGKQNSFANRTLPSAVIIQMRDTQPVSLVGAFEKPVYASGNESVTEVACKRLVAHENAIDAAFGVAPQQTYITCGAPLVKEALEGMEGAYAQLDEAIASVSKQVAAYLTDCGFSAED